MAAPKTVAEWNRQQSQKLKTARKRTTQGKEAKMETTATQEAPKAKMEEKGSADKKAPPPAGTFALLPVTSLRLSPLNPRKTFDAAQDAELAASIREKGIVEPLIVRKNANGNGTTHEVICGARRLRGAQEAKLDSVPVIERTYTDQEALEVMVIENLQREDVPAIEEAQGYKQLLKLGKYTTETLAAKIGKSIRHVQARLKLLTMTKAVRDALEKGTIDASQACEIGRLPGHMQKEVLNEIIETDYQGITRVATIADLRGYIQKSIYRELAGAPWKLDDAKLCPKAGACSLCPKRTSAEGLDGKDCCLDPVCWDAKHDATVKATVENLQDKGEKVLRVSSRHGYSSEKEKGIDAYAYQVESCKPNAAGAHKAVVIDGPNKGKVGTVRLIEDGNKARGAAKAATPGKPTPLAERRKAHAQRRTAWIVDRLREELFEKAEGSFAQFKISNPKDWDLKLMALAVAFGTAHNHTWADNGRWARFKNLLTSQNETGRNKLGEALWKEFVPVFKGRLRYATQNDLPLEDAKGICGLVGLKWEDLEATAVEKLPEPASWAKLNADGTPKTPKATKTPKVPKSHPARAKAKAQTSAPKVAPKAKAKSKPKAKRK